MRKKYCLQAKEQCEKLGSGCAGVYDSGCDNKGAYKLCKAGNAFTNSGSSCIYTPKLGAPEETTKAPQNITVSWTKVSVHCGHNAYSTKYQVFKEAQAECAKMGSDCAGVYDYGCNDVGSYQLCKGGFKFGSSTQSCVYTPKFGADSG